MSDTEFIKAIIRAAESYKGNLPYSVPRLPSGYMPAGQYNSNSFVAGVLKKAGATLPALAAPTNADGKPEFQTPGYGNPMPIP